MICQLVTVFGLSVDEALDLTPNQYLMLCNYWDRTHAS